MSSQDLLNRINQLSGVQGALITTKEGLITESSLPESTDPNMISALFSTVFTQIEVQSKRMLRGDPKKIIVETDSQVFSVFAFDSGAENVLVFGEFGKEVDVENLYNTLRVL